MTPSQRENMRASRYQPPNGWTLEAWRRRRRAEAALTWAALAVVAAAAPIAAAYAWHWATGSVLALISGFWMWRLVYETRHGPHTPKRRKTRHYEL